MAEPDLTQLAGFRVVRRLGSGSRADVYLGHAAGEEGAARIVALKVFRAGQQRTSIDAELAVLSLCRAVSLQHLADVASLGDGALCLVLGRLNGPTLAHWLGERGRPSPGELVTVLASLGATVARLHTAGWALGRITPAAVRFDRAGRPVITSLRTAARLDAGASGAHITESRKADILAFAELVDDVLSFAGTTPDLAGQLREQAASRPLADPLADLEARLFGWAPAAAVAFRGSGDETDDPMPSRLASRVPAVVHTPARLDEPVPQAERESGTARWGLVDRVAGLADTAGFAPLLARLGPVLRARRRPLIAAAGVGVTAVVVILSLVPPADPAGASAEAVRPSASPPAAPSTTPAEVIVPPDPSVTADDPVAAAAALLRIRAGCAAARSVPCLDGAVQSGSPLAEADAYALLTGTEPASYPVDATLTLVERTGDAAIVAIAVPGKPETPPASLLLMRGEAGWRLREVFEP